MSTLSLSNQAAMRKPSRDRASYYTLTWRQKQLLLTLSPTQTTPLLPALESEQLLADCLKRSPIHLVKLTPDIGEAALALWADACAKVNKPAYLSVPSIAALPKKQNRLKWWLKRLVDWSAAALLILVIGPLMLGLSFLIRLQSPGPVFFSQWRVGERGKLFRILKFRTMVTGAELYHHQVMGHQAGLHKCENDPRVTPVGRWMRKYSLDELPQLINVLRGEMSLVGPRPWALYDAVRLSPAVRQRLNALPGITGIWQVTGRSHLRDLDDVNRVDLRYMGSWSLRQDFKILLMTVPKVLSGFGAF
ncbi:heterocyst development glycosyltransferase HepC [Stenomitos frigidus]|uniref:UDP-phosphate galactose phosphotransferase n=1 Tax=Stenomitos frigidus ULC18 TaxID=2107698 RepID=A0A2T1DWQ7_9CYAN|nr:heterocyst development glycosyltransferase HepC [Stenomitos frigidus]PSB24814.1 UDP-phosphate galactose phosphotransferase [Stenomitos frigidus ULC18]